MKLNHIFSRQHFCQHFNLYIQYIYIIFMFVLITDKARRKVFAGISLYSDEFALVTIASRINVLISRMCNLMLTTDGKMSTFDYYGSQRYRLRVALLCVYFFL